MKPIKEIPLVLFTILSQAAAGLTLMEGFFIFFYPGGALLWSPAVPGLAFLCLWVGLACSLFHLGHPSGGIRSFANLRVSWLSREILIFGCYGAVLGLDMVLRYKGMAIPLVLMSSVLAGLGAVAVSARVYKNPGYPALDTFWPFVFF
ncbi:MAG: dimethyl sulfoxide reductase anchor subunit, partial [Proteobacteria bacterium]|nr:dimethyl sulfoxide reductase anchor subunit [Pseudomonadota bacterium]